MIDQLRFPGLPDVLAISLRTHNIFIKEDFPTFDLPINAYSGNTGAGHLLKSVLLITNWADLISIIKIDSINFKFDFRIYFLYDAT